MCQVGMLTELAIGVGVGEGAGVGVGLALGTGLLGVGDGAGFDAPRPAQPAIVSIAAEAAKVIAVLRR